MPPPTLPESHGEVPIRVRDDGVFHLPRTLGHFLIIRFDITGPSFMVFNAGKWNEKGLSI